MGWQDETQVADAKTIREVRNRFRQRSRPDRKQTDHYMKFTLRNSQRDASKPGADAGPAHSSLVMLQCHRRQRSMQGRCSSAEVSSACHTCTPRPNKLRAL